jgi:nitronate monooxygenase
MNLPSLKIGNIEAKIPIIQGGMGIGVSMASLASAVANNGGIGIISAAQPGFKEDDFETNNKEANKRGLKKEIRKAKLLSPDGIIGVNIMVAMKNYKEMIETSVKEKINLIISGAGLPMDLPEMVKGTATYAVPIVSSGRAAALIAKIWDKRYSYLPDAVVVEGPKAGGHLGFNLEQLNNINSYKIINIVREVINVLKPYEEKYNRKIPVIAAGGIYTGYDIAECIKAGAAGVQMATRFAATYECDADIKYKEAYINSKEEDIEIVKSPVGMPGRAIINKFLKKVKNGNIKVDRCLGCIKTCKPEDTPYCITRALINAVTGNVDEGLIFVGANAYKINKIISVKDLIEELVSGAQAALN